MFIALAIREGSNIQQLRFRSFITTVVGRLGREQQNLYERSFVNYLTRKQYCQLYLQRYVRFTVIKSCSKLFLISSRSIKSVLRSLSTTLVRYGSRFSALTYQLQKRANSISSALVVSLVILGTRGYVVSTLFTLVIYIRQY